MTTPTPELQEKNFIHEGYKKNPFPFWVWLFILTALTAIFWGSSGWYIDKMNTMFHASPFLRVTNRELSIFLWQNPEFMRANAQQKANYLTAFRYLDKVTVEPFQANDYVVAPPEVLFRYHTWERLLGTYYIPTAIPTKEFQNFLSYAQEWLPEYWQDAPKAYVKLVKDLPSHEEEDLSALSMEELPLPVRMSFQGWKNFFMDGEKINKLTVPANTLKEFLNRYPNYARNYWRNIVHSYAPRYLLNIDTLEGKTDVPNDQLSPFLKLALFNFIDSQS